MTQATALQRALDITGDMTALGTAAAFRAIASALDAIGVRYFWFATIDASGCFSPLIDTSPRELMVSALCERHRFGEMASELLRVGRTFDTDTAVIDALEPEYQGLLDEHRQIGGAAYYVTAPVFDGQRVAGVASYFFDQPVDARERLLPLLETLSQSAFDSLRAGAALKRTSPLTARQREALQYCAAGKSDWDIGVLMNISAATTHDHIEAAKRRLDVKTRVQAVLAAYKHGWISV